MKKYIVGGAVRDFIMGTEPKDRDYVVLGETPESMTSRGFKQVGADFPVFLSRFTGEEYALARIEKKTGVGYQGFSSDWKDVSLESDLKRRDFTMNAMAFDEENQKLIDPFKGAIDISKRIIKHTSPAFKEDPLRVLRAARFKARFGEKWTIHTFTIEIMQEIVSSEELRHIPGERIMLELMKTENKSEFFKVLDQVGALDQVLPEIDWKDWDDLEVQDETDLFIQLSSGMNNESVDVLADRLKPTTLSIKASKWLNKYWITDSAIPEDKLDRFIKLREADVFRQDTPLFNLLNYYTEGYIGRWKHYLLDYPEEFIDLFQGIELGDAIKEWREDQIKEIVGDGIDYSETKWTDIFLEYPKEK